MIPHKQQQQYRDISTVVGKYSTEYDDNNKKPSRKKKRNLNPRFGGEKYMQRDDR